MFAAQHPERVDGLVLCVPFAQGWLSAPVEDLVGWEDADQVAAYERAWEHIFETWGRGGSLQVSIPGLATVRNLRAFGILERAFASPAMLRTEHKIACAADVRDVLRSVQPRAGTALARPHAARGRQSLRG
jgi:pimeloyl-ACP methyl ester carboxylesterase